MKSTPEKGNMGKHSFKKSHKGKLTAMTMIAGVVATPAVANAAPVNVPGTDQTVEVPDQLIDEANRQAAPYVAQAEELNSRVNEWQGRSPSIPDSPVVSTGQQVADHALSKQGSPYAWGATGPNAFDCSGLTTWAHQQVGKDIPRTSGAQASGGTPVSLSALQPGDVVSFYGASHVGIYVGNNSVVHAPTEGDVVKVTSLDYMPADSASRF